MQMVKNKRGEQLSHAKRMVVIAKLFDSLSQGYYSTSELARQTGISRTSVDKYRPLVDELIAKQKLDRNVIRNLELQRAYKVIEMLMEDLKEVNEAYKDIDPNPDITHMKLKTKNMLYSQIAKHSSRIALITGLNVETHVNVDHSQLVIIRADNHKRPKIINNETETIVSGSSVPEMPTIRTDPPPTAQTLNIP